MSLLKIVNQEYVRYANEQNVDGMLLTGDILDYSSEE